MSSPLDFIPSLGVLSATYCCMPDYGWTHQPACVQTCLVCSLLCNSRVPCSQPWLSLEALRFQRSFWTCMCLKVCCEADVKTILATSAQNIRSKMEFIPPRKLAVVGSYIIRWLLSVVKIGVVVYSFSKNQECHPSPRFYLSRVERERCRYFSDILSCLRQCTCAVTC